MSNLRECQGFWIRLVAYGIDHLVITFLVVPVIGAVITVADLTGVVRWETTSEFLWILPPILPVAYHSTFVGLLSWTPGKCLLGIRVVDEFGNKPGWGKVLGREIFGRFLSGLVFALGHLWVAWDKEKRSWHDKIGGTYVVRKRSKAASS